MRNITLEQIVETVLKKGNEDWYMRESSQNSGFLSENIRMAIYNNKSNNNRLIPELIITLLQSSDKDNLSINKLFACLTHERLRHTLLCYIFGCFLYNSESEVRDNIEAFLSEIWESKGRSPQSKFLLTWLLICLFHDIGYAIEMNNVNAVPLNNEQQCEFFADILDVNGTIVDLLPSFPDRFPQCYKNIPIKYDRYRKMYGIIKNGKPLFDHGVYGGILLNKALEEMPDKYGMPEKYYEYIAWVIMCHNMWFAQDKNTKYVYDLLGMESLYVRKQQYQILFDKYPLLWLLSVVDNIECTKRKVSIKWLKEIIIDELSPDYLRIKVNVRAKNGRYVGEYIQALKGLNDWLIKTDVE